MTRKKKKSSIIPILMALLAVCIIIIAILCIKLFSQKEEKHDVSSSKSSTEASSPTSVSSSTQISEESEVIPEPRELVSNEVFGEAYRKILSSNSYAIDNYYYWQFDYTESEWWPYHNQVSENPCIAFAELTGDNIPEMLLVHATEYNSTEAVISIYTLKGDDAVCIYEEKVDAQIEGGCDYILFSNYRYDVYLYTVSYGTGTVSTYKKITPDASGALKSRVVCEKTVLINDNNGEQEYIYTVDSEETDEEAYNTYVSKITKDEVHALLYDSSINNSSENWIISAKKESMYYGDAVSYLTSSTVVSDGRLPFNSSISLEFASGAGGWGTEMTLNNDGTFEASFHDSDMGDCGTGYDNGTVYIGSCKGTFTNITKIDDYTYKMTLTDFVEEETGSEYIEDSIRFVPSNTYGVDTGEIIFCLPGKPISEIPEYVLTWGYAFYTNISNKQSLPCFMFYNTSTENAFYSY